MQIWLSPLRYWTLVQIGVVALMLATCQSATSGEASQPGPGEDHPQAAEQLWNLEQLRSTTGLSAFEYGTARSDHAEIAQAVGLCQKGFANPLSWSASTRSVLMIALNDTLGHDVSKPQNMSDPGSFPTLTFFQKAAVSFSDRLSRDRLQMRYQHDQSRRWATGYQYATVILGALGTIAIGVRSIISSSSNTSAPTLWSVAAITFSAAGTAAATLSTNGDFQTTELRTSRALAQLQQLHWRVADDIMKDNVLCSSDDQMTERKTGIMDSWRTRYETIQDASMDSLARPGDLSSGGSPARETPADTQSVASPGKAGKLVEGSRGVVTAH